MSRIVTLVIAVALCLIVAVLCYMFRKPMKSKLKWIWNKMVAGKRNVVRRVRDKRDARRLNALSKMAA